jgi:hypothetical protein
MTTEVEIRRMLPKNKLWLKLSGLALAIASPAVMAAWELNMPEGITQISRETYFLHMLIFWICVVIGVVVYGVLPCLLHSITALKWKLCGLLYLS